jgi:hypothetical protein
MRCKQAETAKDLEHTVCESTECCIFSAITQVCAVIHFPEKTDWQPSELGAAALAPAQKRHDERHVDEKKSPQRMSKSLFSTIFSFVSHDSNDMAGKSFGAKAARVSRQNFSN